MSILASSLQYAACFYFQIRSPSHLYSHICSQLLEEGQKRHDNPKFLAASFYIVPNISYWRLQEAWAEKSRDTEVSHKGEADPECEGTGYRILTALKQGEKINK